MAFISQETWCRIGFHDWETVRSRTARELEREVDRMFRRLGQMGFDRKPQRARTGISGSNCVARSRLLSVRHDGFADQSVFGRSDKRAAGAFAAS